MGNDEYDELMAEIDAMQKSHEKDKNPLIYRAFENTFFFLLHHTHWFSDAKLDLMAKKGDTFYKKWCSKLNITSWDPNSGESNEEHMLWEPVRRFKVLNFLDVNKAFGFARAFYTYYGEYAEEHCMQANLKAGDGYGFASYIIRPYFYLRVIGSLFVHHKDHRFDRRMAKLSALSLHH